MADETEEPHSGRERFTSGLPGGAGLRILRTLALGEKNVSELVAITELSQPNVSNHLRRLHERELVSFQKQGRQVIYRIASAGLAHFVLTYRDAGEGGGTVSPQTVAARFLDAVLSLKEEEAALVVDLALAEGISWKQVYLEVFVPALVRVGELWEENKLSVATEHLITGITLRLLHRVSLSLPMAPTANAPSALVGCVEGELHTVGGRMVADFLMAQGWRVWYLNGLLPMEHLLEGVRVHLPDAIVLCISSQEREESLLRTVERLRRWRGEQPLPLLVAGGRYFSEERQPEGLDLWGSEIEPITRKMQLRVEAIRGPVFG